MRTILADDVTAAVRNLCIQACTILGPDVINQIEKALGIETSPTGRMALEKMIQNAEIAAKELKKREDERTELAANVAREREAARWNALRPEQQQAEIEALKRRVR